MFKKKQVITIMTVAVISFLLGTAVITMATGDGNPFDEIWETIYGIQSEIDGLNALTGELQAQVQSLNETIVDLETQIPMKPKVLTVFDYGMRRISAEWSDIISISNVTVWEGANVLVITIVRFYDCKSTGYIKHRMDDVYGEGYSFESMSIVELHHVWTNLSAGNHTFTVPMRSGSPDYLIGVRQIKLTLIIT